MRYQPYIKSTRNYYVADLRTKKYNQKIVSKLYATLSAAGKISTKKTI